MLGWWSRSFKILISSIIRAKLNSFMFLFYFKARTFPSFLLVTYYTKPKPPSPSNLPILYSLFNLFILMQQQQNNTKIDRIDMTIKIVSDFRLFSLESLSSSCGKLKLVSNSKTYSLSYLSKSLINTM